MWWTRHFLIEKIFINVHIFRNPLRARILSSLGLYGTCYKYSHLRFLSDTWPVGLSMLCSFMMDSSLAGLALKGPVLLWPMMRNSSTYLRWDPSTYISPLQLPPPLMGPSSFEWKDPWGDSSRVGQRFRVPLVDGTKLCELCLYPDILSGTQLWFATCVTLVLAVVSDRGITSSFVHFFYKYHSLILSFLYFLQKHFVRESSS